VPAIHVNLGAVEAFTTLPDGSYLGEITKVTHREPTKPGKFAQMMVTYTVIDGDSLGKRQSEFVSLSPQSLGFLKRWFMKFGLGDIPDLIFDDDTDELTDPDLLGYQVIFTVKTEGEFTRVKLVSVEDDVAAPAPTPVPLAVRHSRTVAAPEPAVEEDEVEDEAPAPAPRRPHPAPVAQAAPAAPARRRATLR